MSRKKFIESQGATCKNWTWSWSFINDKDKFIIFGEWDKHNEGNRSLILSKDWEISELGKKLHGYTQGLAHLNLIQTKGYKLKTFVITKSNESEYKKGIQRPKIAKFIPVLIDKKLIHDNGNWYACEIINS